MRDDPYKFRLPDGWLYAEVPEISPDDASPYIYDILDAEIVYEDILDAEVIE